MGLFSFNNKIERTPYGRHCRSVFQEDRLTGLFEPFLNVNLTSEVAGLSTGTDIKTRLEVLSMSDKQGV